MIAMRWFNRCRRCLKVGSHFTGGIGSSSFFDKPITCGKHFRQILSTLAERYLIIDPTERAPSQPVFGNARHETRKPYITGNVLSLSDFPYIEPEPETPAPSPRAGNGSGTYNGTQRKYKDDLDGLIADAKLTRHETGADGKVRVDCPFNSDHKRDAFVGLDSSGYPYFKCHHNSCSGNAFNEMVKLKGIEVVSEYKPPGKPNPGRRHFPFACD